ncbi:MAG TPA: YraN family protein [Candidatus Eisenbacteria bacterium]|nr:YraN family protein [Candidatus Eisenbacteria bacterium]
MDGTPRPPRRTTAQRLGAAAEDIVAEQLTAAGWTILGRNVHVGRAELDLVGIDPGPPATLVVVEVRWRGRRDFGLPEETVDHRKITRIRRAAFAVREAGALPDGTSLPGLALRFDLVAVEPGGRLRHHRHVA